MKRCTWWDKDNKEHGNVICPSNFVNHTFIIVLIIKFLFIRLCDKTNGESINNKKRNANDISDFPKE